MSKDTRQVSCKLVAGSGFYLVGEGGLRVTMSSSPGLSEFFLNLLFVKQVQTISNFTEVFSWHLVKIDDQ